jgi:hypothetical protein
MAELVRVDAVGRTTRRERTDDDMACDLVDLASDTAAGQVPCAVVVYAFQRRVRGVETELAIRSERWTDEARFPVACRALVAAELRKVALEMDPEAGRG